MERLREPWKPVSSRALGLATAVLAGLASLLRTVPDGYIRILDDANLVFHEAGHPIFGVLGGNWEPLGGTLGQLAVPLAAVLVFVWRREPLAVAVTLFWFFENFFSVARYMADARALVLPLVGGGDHDWNILFARWGVLRSDTRIAANVRLLGWTGLVATWAWLAWRWTLRRGEARALGEAAERAAQRSRPQDSVVNAGHP